MGIIGKLFGLVGIARSVKRESPNQKGSLYINEGEKSLLGQGFSLDTLGEGVTVKNLDKRHHIQFTVLTLNTTMLSRVIEGHLIGKHQLWVKVNKIQEGEFISMTGWVTAGELKDIVVFLNNIEGTRVKYREYEGSLLDGWEG